MINTAKQQRAVRSQGWHAQSRCALSIPFIFTWSCDNLLKFVYGNYLDKTWEGTLDILSPEVAVAFEKPFLRPPFINIFKTQPAN
ncbi:hypothetical protein QUA04_20605 [Microcoleus sp. S13_C5]